MLKFARAEQRSAIECVEEWPKEVVSVRVEKYRFILYESHRRAQYFTVRLQTLHANEQTFTCKRADIRM